MCSGIVLDGKICAAGEALLKRLTPGIRKMRGAFETMLVKGGRVQHFDAHYRRLCRGMKALSVIPRPAEGRAEGAQNILGSPLRGQGLPQKGLGMTQRVRLMVWREGRRARWAVIAAPYAPPTAKQYAQGVDVLLVRARKEFRKKDGLFKSLDYKIYRDAAQAARKRNCFEALLVDKGGRVIDGSRTNLLLLTDSALVVPPVGYGTFDGLMRRRIVQLARAAGLKICRRGIMVEELKTARACWLTNSLIGIIRVRCVHGL